MKSGGGGNTGVSSSARSAKKIKGKPGRPRLSDAERARRAAALAAVKPKRVKPVKRVTPVDPVAEKKRAQMDNAAAWRASYVAARYSISKTLVFKLVRNGTLPSKRVGRTIIIAAAPCIAYFEGKP